MVRGLGEFGSRRRKETKQNRTQQYEERKDQIHDADRSVPDVRYGALKSQNGLQESTKPMNLRTK